MRNATLTDLVELLKDQQARKLDMVLPASAFRSRGGMIVVQGAEWQFDEDGAFDPNGEYHPTEVFDEGVSGKFKIPLAYVRKLRAEAPDLYDANLNGWLHGRRTRSGDEVTVVREADGRRFLLRCFRGSEGVTGVARALLSDRFGLIDNFDVLTAALDGVRQAGVAVDNEGIQCDLSDRRMFVRIPAPQIAVQAPKLLEGYRSPFSDPDEDAKRNHGWSLQRGLEAAAREGMAFDGDPVVFAGIEIVNSEVGQGQFEIRPVITVKVCKNGLVITQQTFKRVHIGGKLDDGVIDWSAETQRKAIELIVAKTTDAVRTFLSVEFVRGTVEDIEEKAGTKVRNPKDTIEVLAKKLSFSEGETAGILNHFILGGQMTAGGIMQAVTSYSQTVANADRAHELDEVALKVLDLVPAA